MIQHMYSLCYFKGGKRYVKKHLLAYNSRNYCSTSIIRNNSESSGSDYGNYSMAIINKREGVFYILFSFLRIIYILFNGENPEREVKYYEM